MRLGIVLPVVVLGLGLVSTGCKQERNQEHNSIDSATAARKAEAKEQVQKLNLITTPTELDMIRLRTILAGQVLGRVTATADAYRVGYHVPTTYKNITEENLDKQFFLDFWAGNYNKIDQYKTQFSALLPTNPNEAPSPLVLARLGFLNVWQFAERYRLLANPGPFPPEAQGPLFQALGGCQQYFDAALQQAPSNSVFGGFAADCTLLMGQGPNGEQNTLRGLELAAEAVQRNPEFNLFTVGYALTFLPPDSQQFKLGLEMMFRNLDTCFDTQIDRNNPNVANLMLSFSPVGDKRFCIDTEKAPYNFEGFFMILGDLLIKAGKPTVAKIAYQNAKLLPSFQGWPQKDKLEARIAAATNLVTPFQAPVDPMVKPNYPTITFNTEYACMVCHQKPALP